MVLPRAAEAVMIIRDMVSHSISDKANALGKAAGLPIAMVPRKWALALPILQRQGILPVEPPLDTTPTSEPQVVQFIADFIRGANQEGREPSRSEILGALHREASLSGVLGPRMTISTAMLTTARKIAVSETETETESPPDPLASLSDYATLVMEEAFKEASLLLGSPVDPHYVGELKTLVTGASDEAYQEALESSYQNQTAKLARSGEDRDRFFKQWVTRLLTENETKPTYRAIRADASSRFGVAPSNDLIKSVRRTVGMGTPLVLGDRGLPDRKGFGYNTESLIARIKDAVDWFNTHLSAEQKAAMVAWLIDDPSEVPGVVQQALAIHRGNPVAATTVMIAGVLHSSRKDSQGILPHRFVRGYKSLYGARVSSQVAGWVAEYMGLVEADKKKPAATPPPVVSEETSRIAALMVAMDSRLKLAEERIQALTKENQRLRSDLQTATAEAQNALQGAFDALQAQDRAKTVALVHELLRDDPRQGAAEDLAARVDVLAGVVNGLTRTTPTNNEITLRELLSSGRSITIGEVPRGG